MGFRPSCLGLILVLWSVVGVFSEVRKCYVCDKDRGDCDVSPPNNGTCLDYGTDIDEVCYLFSLGNSVVFRYCGNKRLVSEVGGEVGKCKHVNSSDIHANQRYFYSKVRSLEETDSNEGKGRYYFQGTDPYTLCACDFDLCNKDVREAGKDYPNDIPTKSMDNDMVQSSFSKFEILISLVVTALLARHMYGS